MENAAGEDLAWFWQGWFYNNYKLDIALIDARYTDKDVKNGIVITLANKQQMAMPITVEAIYKDGGMLRVHLPVETWLQNKITTFTMPTTREIKEVKIDPDHAIPDMNRVNNVLKIK